MLTADRHTRALTVTCDKCRATRGELGVDRDAAARELAAAGWFEAARRGAGRERWHWWCPVCAPRPGGGHGLHTGMMVTPKKA